MADESKRVAALSADKLRRLMSRLTEQQGTAAGIQRISRTLRGGALPLSFAQERLWFLDRLGAGGAAYHIPAAVRLRGPLDAIALERTLGLLVDRHEALRTTFGEQDGLPVQTVHAAAGLAMPRVDLASLPEALRAGELARISREEAVRPFDLTRGPLLRTVLVRLGAGDHVLVLAFHHIITDGWALGVLVREVAALYPGLAAGAPADLPELPVQPADHAVWEREHLRGEALETELSFWRERLAGLPPLELPADRPRPATPSFRGGLAALDLPGAAVHTLEALAQRERATPFMALLALFQTLLLRYSGQDDFGVGTPVAHRTRSEVEGLIGLFVNTVVLRADLSGEPGFAELLRRTRETTLAAFAHEEIPFEKLVEELRPEREPGRNPFFQVLFTLQNQPWPKLHVGELDLELSEVDTGTARTDLTLIWRERDGGLAGTLEYSTDLFERASAERLLGHLGVLLQGALADPERAVWDLPLLAETERAQILGDWRGSATPYPHESMVHELVAEQAATAGDRVAVEAGDARLTYAELESRANQLAHHLRRLGVEPDCLVGVAVPRSPETVVGLLGTLKAGGAYLPLDPAWPRERLDALVHEARPAALITLEPLLDRLPGGMPVVCLDRDRDALAAELRTAPAGGATAESLVYVLYTSGSTGHPKGVAVPHRGVVRLVRGAGFARLDAGQTLLQLAPLSFDASTLEIWGALCNGGRLVLAPPEPPSLAELGDLLTRHGVTTLWLTAGLFHQMVDQMSGEGIDGLRGLSQLLAGGDVLSPLHVRRALAALPGCTLINGYGPTENTTFTCCHPLTDAAADRPVPIGRPIGNTTVVLLDRAGRPVPMGVPGELLAGGDGLARGYLGRPDLTAERFVPRPLAGEEDAAGARLYRTGDLARWRPDGTLDFLGRIDQQVKIRGFRIEPEEIETALAAHPEIAKCAVVVQGTGEDRRLVAWVALREGASPEPAELRAWLATRLPAYMVPSVFAPLEVLPLTSHGKVDRRALARLQPPSVEARGTEPETPLEHRIAAMWSDLLGQPRIGRDDDFFALGGHSLLATRVVSRIREELGIDLPLVTVFENPTLADLAAAVERETASAADDGPIAGLISAGAGAFEAPLSFAQERLWFLEQLRPGSSAYNIPAAIRLAGALDPAVLAACFDEVVRRHAALRTTFLTVGGDPLQQVDPPAGIPLPLVDLAALPEEIRRPEALRRTTAEAAAPFDLAAGPLLRTTLLRLGEDEHLLLLTLHHIVADGWSVGILVREIAALYAAFAAGQPSPLPELPVQYADFALWQRRRLSGERLSGELDFWSERLHGAPAELALPADRSRPAVVGERGASCRLRLAPGLAEGVRALALQAGATPFMVLLAAFETLLSRLSGQTDLTVGTPVAGRQRAEIEGLMGLFVNTLVLRTDLADDPSFEDLVARTRQHALEAYAHQEVPFEKLVEQLQPGRNLGNTPLFQAFFVLQNAPVEPLRLPGLAVELLPEETRTAKFDLTLVLSEERAEDGDGFAGELVGSADLFEEATIERWAGCFERLLAAALQAPGESVFELPLLAEAERRTILGEWSSAGWELPAPASIHQLFAEQAARTPEKAAAVCQGASLTYRELAERTARLAGWLACREDSRLVGLMAAPDLALPVGMLGILQAGRGFVPLDPDLPAERLERMIAECGLTVLAADRRNLARARELAAHVICLDEELDTPPLAAAGADDGTAYVIFTSGSTGVPKGVPITHENLVPFLLWSREIFGFGEHTRVLQSLSYAFDFGVFEILSTLLFGGTLFLRGEAGRSDIEGYLREVRDHAVNTLHTTPSFFRAVAAEAGAEGLPTVEVLHLGGEALTEALVAEAFTVTGNGCRVFNGYGPTEAAVNCALFEVGSALDWRPRGLASLPIGHPSAANRLYVLDRRMQPVPAGVHGELLVGGVALSRGYLGRPDLTAARFIPDPFGEPGGRLYRTGDLVRFHTDGAIEFLGRVDNQVKVRGYRIELEEIEAALAAHPEVSACAVLAVRPDGGEVRLAAWVAARQETLNVPDTAELRRFLGRTLPAYMVPASFTFLPELPLNASGKVDRKALALLRAAEEPRGSAEPATPLERRIAAVWSELLGQPRIGRDDDFFALGGHSLLATRVISRLRAELGVELPVMALFETPTPAGLAVVLAAGLEAGGAALSDEPISAVAGLDEAPLSFSQERLWFLEQLRPGSATYNIPAAVRLAGALDPAVLAACFGEIVRRHATLRATFSEADGEPRQKVAAPAGLDLPLVDLAALPEGIRDRESRRLAAAEAAAPFDLAAGPLLRATLLRLEQGEHLLLLTIHHIVADGWSVGILIREMAALSEAFAAGQPSPLPELPIQYADFALWQRRRLSGERLAGEIDAWRELLRGAPAELGLPTDRPRLTAPSGRATSWPLRLSAEGVRRLALKAGATPFMVLLAAFEVLLSRLSGQTDLTVGTPVAGRQRAEVEGLIGFFVNTLVLRADLADAPSFDGLLAHTRRHALEAFAHQEVPFEKLVEQLQPGRDLGHTPLFQAFFALQNAPVEPLRLPGLALELLPEESGTAKFDLTLVLSEERAEDGDGFAGELIGNADLLEEATVRRWAGAFERLLAAALESPGASVFELPLLSEAERQTILGEWSSAGWETPAPVPVHELFAEQAARTPDKAAVVCRGEALSYRELAERAGRLAGRLARLGNGGLVGLMATPDLPLAVGLLGILRAGRGFVPLDPTLPAERQERMVAECGLTVLAADRRSLARATEIAAGAHVVCLEEDLEPLPAAPAGTADATAYVIFTSGSTGVPKGVPITHENLLPFLLWSREVFGFGEHTRVLQSLSYAFDFGVFEILSTVLFGGTLVLRGDAERSDIEDYLREVRKHSVNTLHTTPSFFRAVMASAGAEGLPTIEVLHLGGEALTEALVEEAFRAAGPRCRIFNGYGPTEAAVNCALYEVGTAADWRPRGLSSLPIGHPSAANRLYVLDRRMQPVPAGVPGELLVGGVTLSRGYLDRPDLTAARFVPDPFGEPGGRLYRTGDLVRFHADGAIEFLGRVDHQVKIRGYRIELEEIEAALAAHPEVATCAVLAVRPEGGETQLVAWAAPRQEPLDVPDTAELRRFLGRTLPAYMVPASFNFLPELPLNTSGKVDRKALALLPIGGAAPRGGGEPATALERRIAAVWSDLLGRPRIGRDDDFFALGGHSLLATRVVSRLRAELGVEVPVLALFENPTLAGLAEAVEGAGAATLAGEPIVDGEGLEELPLSFSQERLWFLEQLRPGTATYNIPAAVRLAGALDPAVLAAGLGEIVRRHSTLRATFPEAGGKPRQQVASPAGVPLSVVDLAALPEEVRNRESRRLTAAEAAAPFDLAAGPLLRASLLRLGADEHLLLITVHHIVSDGWSMGLLIREMAILSEALPELPELPVQYADFASWQRRRLDGATLERELDVWSERLHGAPAELALPTDRPRPAVLSGRGASRRLRLSAERSEEVRALALRSGATPFMVLLAAFEALLSRLSGQTDLTVGTPVAGRPRAEVESLIGFFVNTLVLRADLSDAPSFAVFLARTRRHALEAYAHQELPFEKLVEHLQPGRSLGHNPLFQVLFALQNQPWPELRLPGLALSPVEVDSGTAKTDLSLVWHEVEGAYEAVLEYSTDLFEGATAERLLRWSERLLGAALDSPASRVTELPLLDAAERTAVLDLSHGLQTPYPRAAILHELVREQARRAPEAVAVEMGGARLTYGELDARANRLAHRLLALGVRPDSRVGLAVERSADLVVGMLGILAAGGAYVPLDLSYPQERLDWMVEDAGLAALVHGGAWQSAPEAPQVDLGDPALAGESPDAPAVEVTAGHLAYIIYTSGSTGRPKGVAVSHRAVVRLVAETDYVRLEPSDRVAQASNASFDAATFEIWGALCAGARLIVVPREEVLSPEALAARLDGDGITALFLTTALFNQMARQAPGAFRGLRHLLFGGELVDPGAVREVLRQGPPERLLHVYGPTEATTFATWYQVAELPAQAATVPIGRPLANGTAWVVDPAFELLPPGVPGELLLGGDGLARGYHERPEVTAGCFVPHPWSDRPGERLYRTGDLVRRDEQGAIEFLGRIDQQVKIRGFRIEPGEIEAELGTHPEVAECAVVVFGDIGGIGEERRLVAWLAPREGAVLEPAALRAWLAARLPAHLVPAVFAILPALPLTPNGKVDRRALARLQPPAVDSRGSAPETPVEICIAAVWSDLLRQPRIGRDDSFFELGGHSLLATQVVSRLRDQLGIEIPVRTLFEEPTLAGLARWIETARRTERPEAVRPAAPVLRPVERHGRLPLSFAQERLWFLEQLEPGSAFYNIPLASRLTGPLQVAALRQGITELVRRHESLRTTFGDEQGLPYQVIADAAPADVPLVDLSGLPEAARDRELQRQVTEETRRPFDLERGPLFRIPLFRLGPQDHALVPTMHHIISDGWSMTVLLREIAALYDALSAGRTPVLPELPVQYADYAVWQRGYLQGAELEARLAFWRERLTGVPGLQLPTDRPRPPVETFRGRQSLVALNAGLTRRLHELSNREGVTLYMTLLAVFQTLLLRITGQTDLPVGSPIANRYRSEVEGVIGFFANTIVLRTDLSGNPTFRELLGRVREVTLGAYAHEDLPFEKLVEEIQPERDMSRNPLFQVMCVLQNQPWPEAPMGEVEITSLPVDSGTAKFDLTLFWREDAGVLAGLLEHNTDLFDDATAWRLYRHHETLLRAALDDPEARIGALPMLDDSERHQILREWNGASEAAAGAVWDGLCIHLQIEEQAARTPDALAVIDGERTLTYAELDARANRLARGLARRGVRPEALVGICVERSLEMVVAALAVLKAGGALVALDPAYPRERLAAIINDARLAVLLTQESLLQHFPQHQGIAFLLERGDDPFPEESEEAPRVEVDSDHPIYAIYTSGSTGQPKGIVVTHRAFSNLLAWQLGDPGLRPGGRTVQFATFGFCVSFQEMLSSWCSGGTLVLADEMTRRDLPGLALFLEDHQIDRLHLPFAALKHLAEAAVGQRLPARLRTVITAGEQLQVTPAVRSLFERLPGCTLSNQYGASETHVVTALTLSGDPAGWPAIPPVGRPVDNVGIHLLDAAMQPAPLGVPGELYAGGACTPRCYLNDPVLTASKLVPDPFSGVPGARLYRTGDAARYLADGRIEYHGRIDTQVKIRGFRVELGEIETVLARHPGVRDAAVVARPGHDGQRLVAYVVPAGESDGLFDELRSLVKQKLPEHMLPSAFVEMPVLPVNANGKLDQAALPEPEAAAPEQDYVAPRTPIEELIAGIWAEVLGLESVGVCSDFFELGGHSLLATQVVARMRKALGVDLGVRSLFEARTVEGLTLAVAEALLDMAGSADVPLEGMDRVRRDEPLPLSFAQQRLWFLDQLTPRNPVYNLPATIELTGRLDRAALAATFTEVVRRHEVLRTAYSATEGDPVQVIAEPAAFALPLVDLQGLRPEETGEEIDRLVAAEARRPFDLGDLQGGPMLRATLLRVESERHAVLLNMHHIASDGWSLGVLVREVGILYTAFAAGRPSPLPELPVQYADFAAWQRRHLSSERLEAEIGWWRDRLGGMPPALDLPTDHPRQAALSGRGAAHTFRIDREVRAGLAALSQRQGTTLFMALLASFAALLGRHAGQDDLALGTPIAGRTRVETEPLIGFFVNTLVLRTDLSGDPGFAELLDRVREATLSAYAHQEIPFERLVGDLVPERDLSRPPLVQVLFGLQNTPQGRLELPGLELAVSSMDTGAARVELTCMLSETEQGLQGNLEYSRDLYEGATIERMAGHFARLLAGVVADPRRRLSELPLLSAEEREQLLVEWGGETRAYPREATIHALFAEQAALRPDAIAVAGPDEWLTYGELRRRAGRQARRLAALGVGPEVRVGICLDRSAARIVATLAVLEAGGAYVPLDPSHPWERLSALIEASAVSVVVTEERWAAALPSSAAAVLCIDREEAWEGSAELPEVPASALAYVMYTSGSTGEPKGVAVPHRAVVRLVRETGYARFGPDEVFLHLAPYAFDASTLELWGALLNGGRVAVPPPGVLSPLELGELLREQGVTTLWLTAGLFHQMVEDNLPGLAGVRQLLAGGDVLSPEHVRRVAAELPGTQLINGYGPTENTTFTCCHPVEGPESGRSPVPLGRPIANTWVAVLDRHLEPVPVGVAGELCAGGDGLARGYLGRPGWTAERFVPDPFCALRGEAGGRLYRTGDRVRHLPDGRIELLGRLDAQVKIRGFRIEPGEVEAALVRCAGVREAAVVARPGRDGQRLVAYVVPASPLAEGNGSLFDALRTQLRQKLPEPMIPSAFVEMPYLPLNANGKLDRAALPEPETALAREEHVAPRTPIEELIAGIWAEVLGLERVGVTSDFFALGGHSLLATRMVTRLRQTLGVDLSVRAVFEARTVEELTLTVAGKLLELADDESALAAFAAAEVHG
jgi:amino acid adenylation domain-containing protein